MFPTLGLLDSQDVLSSSSTLHLFLPLWLSILTVCTSVCPLWLTQIMNRDKQVKKARFNDPVKLYRSILLWNCREVCSHGPPQKCPPSFCSHWTQVIALSGHSLVWLQIYLFYVSVSHIYVCMCTTHAPDIHGGQKTAWDPQELKLAMAGNHHMGPKNRTHVLCKSTRCPQPLASLTALKTCWVWVFVWLGIFGFVVTVCFVAWLFSCFVLFLSLSFLEYLTLFFTATPKSTFPQILANSTKELKFLYYHSTPNEKRSLTLGEGWIFNSCSENGHQHYCLFFLSWYPLNSNQKELISVLTK